MTETIQGLDRYAYVENHPINYYDGSGHSIECSVGTCTDFFSLSGWKFSYGERQPDNDTCAPTAIAAAISVILGQHLDAQLVIASFEAWNPTPQKPSWTGTLLFAQADGINEMGFKGVKATAMVGGTRQHLLDNLRAGKPTLVTISWGDDPAIGHTLLVTGYCATTHKFTFWDPALGKEIDEDFFESWYGVTFDDAWLNQPNDFIASGSMVIIEYKEEEPPSGQGSYGEPSNSWNSEME